MFDPDYDLFATVVASGSLSAAARALHISPAMASKRLVRLEERLGARLVHRTTRRLELTEAGRMLHADVDRIRRELDQAEQRVSGRDGLLKGRLRVSAPTSFGRLHVAPHLLRFLDEHPDLQLEVQLGDSYADLIKDRIDVAIRIAASVKSGLVAHILAPNRRVLCASPSYVAAHGAPDSIRELSSHPLLAAGGQLPWRLAIDRRTLLVHGTSRVITNSSEVVRELCLAGAGIALRSLWDIGDELARGTLVRVLDRCEGAVDTNIVAVHPRAPATPASVAAFIAFLDMLYRPKPPWAA